MFSTASLWIVCAPCSKRNFLVHCSIFVLAYSVFDTSPKILPAVPNMEPSQDVTRQESSTVAGPHETWFAGIAWRLKIPVQGPASLPPGPDPKCERCGCGRWPAKVHTAHCLVPKLCYRENAQTDNPPSLPHPPVVNSDRALATSSTAVVPECTAVLDEMFVVAAQPPWQQEGTW